MKLREKKRQNCEIKNSELSLFIYFPWRKPSSIHMTRAHIRVFKANQYILISAGMEGVRDVISGRSHFGFANCVLYVWEVNLNYENKHGTYVKIKYLDILGSKTKLIPTLIINDNQSVIQHEQAACSFSVERRNFLKNCLRIFFNIRRSLCQNPGSLKHALFDCAGFNPVIKTFLLSQNV